MRSSPFILTTAAFSGMQLACRGISLFAPARIKSLAIFADSVKNQHNRSLRTVMQQKRAERYHKHEWVFTEKAARATAPVLRFRQRGPLPADKPEDKG